MKKISAIILNYNTSDMTHKAVAALLAAELTCAIEVIVVDNASSEALAPFTDARVRLIRNDQNLGFARGVNKGLEKTSGDCVLLLNSDVIVSRDSLKFLLQYLDDNKQCGIVAPSLIYPNGKFQTSSGRFPNFWREFLRFSTLWKIIPNGTLTPRNMLTYNYFRAPRRVDWVSGGCMLIRRQVLDAIGGLDAYFFFGVEDFDFCYRAQAAGWKVVYYPLTKVTHYHGFSSGGRRSTASLTREAAGMDYFLAKNLAKKKALRLFVSLLYKAKISVLNILLPSLRNNESFTRK